LGVRLSDHGKIIHWNSFKPYFTGDKHSSLFCHNNKWAKYAGMFVSDLTKKY